MNKLKTITINIILAFWAFLKDLILVKWVMSLFKTKLSTAVTLVILGVVYVQSASYYDKFVDEYNRVNDKQALEAAQEQNLTFEKIGDNLYTLTGGVGMGDCERIVPQMPDRFAVILESPGGNLAEGSCLAAHLKIRDVVTIVRDTSIMDEQGKTIYTPGKVPEQMGNDYMQDKVVCASACSLLFLAGDKRYLMGEVYLGIHGPGTPEGAIRSMSGKQLEASAFRTAANLIRLVEQLGVTDDEVKLLFIQIPNSSMYWLNPRDFEVKPGLVTFATHYVNFHGLTATNFEAAGTQ
jgi:hypothetical protein